MVQIVTAKVNGESVAVSLGDCVGVSLFEWILVSVRESAFATISLDDSGQRLGVDRLTDTGKVARLIVSP